MAVKRKRTNKEFDDYFAKMVKKYKDTKRSFVTVEKDEAAYIAKLAKKYGNNFVLDDVTDREWKTYLRYLGEMKASLKNFK